MRVKDCWYVELGEGTVTMELEKKKKKNLQPYFFPPGSNMQSPVLCTHAVYVDNICYLIYSRLHSAIYSICKLIFFLLNSAELCAQEFHLMQYFISDYREFFLIKRIHYISMVQAKQCNAGCSVSCH